MACADRCILHRLTCRVITRIFLAIRSRESVLKRSYLHSSADDLKRPGPFISLNDGYIIPVLGLGLYKVGVGKETFHTVQKAIKEGYQLIDTAAYYKNEKDVGEALKAANVPRSSIYIVTKVWDDMHGYEDAFVSLQNSLKELDMHYIDLALIHSPSGGKVIETWRALEDAKSSGFIRSIGVSNFGIHHLQNLSKDARLLPVVNQIEVHPCLQEREVVDYCHANRIRIMAYSPLAKGKIIEHPTVCEVSQKYKRSGAQILIRWSLQNGYVCIPKSVHGNHISENARVFDFELNTEDMNKLNALEKNFRTGTDKIKKEWTWT